MVGCSLLLVFLVVATTAGYGYVHYRFGQISSVDVPGLHKSSSGRPFNLLVVGSDSRESLDDADGSRYGNVGGQRNDTTLVVRVEPARKRVSMLSIPRDLVVPIAGGGENRINAAFTGGPGQLVKTIEQNFGVPIHHYVLIDFDGFRAIVDALGGIDVRFPYPSRDLKSGLDIREAGCRHLNGGRALALARSRYFAYQLDGVWHSDPWADLGRIRRQQAFLQALVKAALDKGLTNPVRANAFVGSLVHEVTKDSGLRVSDVIRTGTAFRSFSPSKLATYTLPVTVSTDHPLGDVLLLKQPDATTVVDRFLGRAPPGPRCHPRRHRPRQHPGHHPQRPRHHRPGRHHRHQAPRLRLPHRHRRQRPLRRPPQVPDRLRPRPPRRRPDPRQHPHRRRPPHRRPHPHRPQPHPHPRPRLHRHPPPGLARSAPSGPGTTAGDSGAGWRRWVGPDHQEAQREEGRSRPPPLRPPPLLSGWERGRAGPVARAVKVALR